MSEEYFPEKDEKSPSTMQSNNDKRVLETNISATSEISHADNELEQPSFLDEQWECLSQDWQSQPIVKTDIDKLLKQTRKRTRWAKSCYVLNVIATVGLMLSFLYGIYNNEFGKPWNTYLGLGGVLSLIFVYYERKIRINAWQQISNAPDKAVENALAGYRSSLKYMMLTKWSCLPFGILANWFVYSMGQENGKSTLGAFLFINIFLVVIYIGTEVIYRKRKKEHQELLTKKQNNK